MIWLLLLTNLVALALYYFAPKFWIERDVAAFEQNGSKDTLHATFHRQRLKWRVAFTVVVGLLAALPLVGHVSYFVSALGLVAIGSCYFFATFNPGLNKARKLAYVEEWYVSPDPRAAWFPDRLIWNRALRAFPGRTAEELRRLYAGHLLRLLCRWVLAAGVVLYVLSLVGSWLLR